MKSLRLILTLLLSSLFFVLDAQNTVGSNLTPCPNSPNCVSTQETRKRKRMKPIPFTVSADLAIQKLERLLSSYPNATLIKKDGNYLHYTFKTKIGNFIDDVKFLMDTEAQVIHFRSASGKGFGDFGKNRRRMRGVWKDWEKIIK